MMRYARTLCGLIGGGFAVIAASQGCSPEAPPKEFPTTTSSTSSSSGMGGAGGTSGSGDGGLMIASSVSGTGGAEPSCDGIGDKDDDGYLEPDDCNDCDPSVNPGAVEVIAEQEPGKPLPTPVDEDCDGTIDNVSLPCDDGLVLDSLEPMDAAKAMGICDPNNKYIKKVSWVVANGGPPPVDAQDLANFHLGHGIMSDYGPNNPPKEGKALLVLSSGTARKLNDPDYVHRNFDKGYISQAPFGFPKESPSCPGVKTGSPRDAAGLEIEFIAPTNAQGISFDFNFFTFEWPQYICTTFNDFFVANLTYADNLKFPKGQTDGNISFDANKNPISVNNAFLDVCGCPGGAPCLVPPNSAQQKSFDCILGKSIVGGTPFDKDDSNPGWTNGATGWLRTNAPVDPGKKFTLRLVTYDSSDGMVDSTTLIDNWKWSAKPGTVETVIPPD